MKKYITLLSFIAIFFVGMQSQAQNSRAVEAETPEAIAKKQTYDLHKAVNLTGDQQRATYKVLVDLQQNFAGLSDGNEGLASVQEAKASLLEKSKGSLKKILTEEQFNIYLKSLEIKKQ